MDVFSPNANAFRFYDDDADEANSTPLANQTTNITVNVDAGNVAFQLRYRVQNATAVAGATTDDYTLQRSHNAGAFSTVNGSTVIIASTSGLTNNNATTNRATNGITDGTGSFVAGEQCTDGTLDNHQLTASNFTEHAWGCTVVAADVNHGDTIDFRISLNGGAPGMTNSVTPRITIQKAATGTGALVAQAADVTGSGTSSSTGTGALAAQAAAIDGEGIGGDVSTGTGALTAQAAVVDGSGTSSSSGTGALSAQAADVAGTGTSSSTGTGLLTAQAATVVGSGTSQSAGAGALLAGSSIIVGEGEVSGGDPPPPEVAGSQLMSRGAGGGSGRRIVTFGPNVRQAFEASGPEPSRRDDTDEQIALEDEIAMQVVVSAVLRGIMK